MTSPHVVRSATAVGLLIAGACYSVPGNTRAVAMRHYENAIAAWAAGRPNIPAEELRAAWRADPTFGAAMLSLARMYANSDVPRHVKAWLIEDARRDPQLAICARVALTDGAGPPIDSVPEPDVRSTNYCALAAWFDFGPSPREHATKRAAVAARLVELAPGVVLSYRYVTQIAGNTHDPERLIAATEWARDPRVPALSRAFTLGVREMALRAAGRLEEAHRDAAAGQAIASQLGEVARTELEYTRAQMAGGVEFPDASAATTEARRRAMHDAESWLETTTRSSNAEAAWQAAWSLGQRTLDQGALDRSVNYWNLAVRQADAGRDPVDRASAYVRRGRTQVKRGAHAAAEHDLLAASEYAGQADSYRWRPEAAHNLLHLYEAMGRTDDALRAGADFIRYTRSPRPSSQAMMSQRDVGNLLRHAGRSDDARMHFARMVTEVDRLGGHYDYYAGEYFDDIGDIARARAYYASDWVHQGEGSIRSLAAVVRLALEEGDYAGAEANAAKHDSVVYAAQPEFRPLLPQVMAARGDDVEADAAYARARITAGARGQEAAWSDLALEHAGLLLRRDRYAAAAALAESAVVRARGVGSRETAMRARALAIVAGIAGGTRSFRTDDASLRALVRESRASGVARLEIDVRQLYGEALARASACDEALPQFARAQMVLDSVATTVPETGARHARLGTEDAPLRSALAVLARCGGRAPNVAQFAVWSAQRKDAVSNTAVWPPADTDVLARVRARLAPDEAAVDFALLDRFACALVVTRAQASVVWLPLTPDSIAGLTRRLRAGTQAVVGTRLDLRRVSFDADAAHQLFRATLGAIAGPLAGVRRLTIIPDGVLALVPFDALVATRSPTPAYALDHYQITYAASLADAPARTSLGAGAVVAAIGDSSVAGANREVAAITRLWKGRAVRTLAGSAPTPAALRAVASEAAIIHVAAHAVSNETRPDASYLALAPSANADGRLGADAAMAWPLQGALIVLSACETGVGRVAGRAGALSLGRAFLEAGAGGVVATLWSVGEASADVSAEFHAGLARGVAPDEALHRAKLELRRKGMPPLVWGAWTFTAPHAARRTATPTRAH